MLTKQQARALVEAALRRPDPYDPDIRLQIVDESTIEKDWGWIFFYQSAEYLDTGKSSDLLVGNAPYMVNKRTGELISTGTAWPIEKYIEDYETKVLSGC